MWQELPHLCFPRIPPSSITFTPGVGSSLPTTRERVDAPCHGPPWGPSSPLSLADCSTREETFKQRVHSSSCAC